MNKFNKVISFVSVAMLLAACGGGGSSDDGNDKPVNRQHRAVQLVCI